MSRSFGRSPSHKSRPSQNEIRQKHRRRGAVHVGRARFGQELSIAAENRPAHASPIHDKLALRRGRRAGAVISAMGFHPHTRSAKAVVSWNTLPGLLVAGLSAYIAAYHLLLFRGRRRLPDLWFSATCLAMATYALSGFVHYHLGTAEAGEAWQRTQCVAILLATMAFLAFVREFAGFTPPRALLWIERGFGALAILAIFERTELTLTRDEIIREVSTPFGMVRYVEFENGPLINVLGLCIPLFGGYVLWAARAGTASRGNPRRRWPLVGAASFVLLGLGIDGLAQHGLLPTLYVGELSWAAMLVLMSWTLSYEVVEAERTQARLEETERRIATTHDAISDAVVTTDLAGNILQMNRAAEAMLATSLSTARGRALAEFAELTAPDATVPVGDPIRYAVGRSPDPYGPLPRLVTKDGHDRRVDVGGAPLVSPLGQVNGAVIVFRDLTVQHHAIESLRHAKKMESMGQLAGGIAHDLNNLLTPIVSYVDLIRRTDDLSERSLTFLGHVQDAALRAASLTRQLLALSRKQVLDVQVIDLAEFVRRAAPLMERLATENVRFVYRLEDEGSLVQADPEQLEQILLNLVANARDAMPNGGEILVTARPLGDKSVNLQVADTGDGMGPTTMGRIFEPFFTTKPRGRGTGLGLASVKGIVEQHGGAIYVDSEVGAGTTFDIVLPRAESEAAPRSSRTGPESELPRGRETVLVVEDDPGVRATLRDSLAQLGYRVVTADGLAMAVARFEAEAPDLLVCDVVMPGADGPRVRALLNERREIPCLFVTGHADDRLGERGILTGGVDVLHKPFTTRQLAEAVRMVLDRRSPRKHSSPRLIGVSETSRAETG